MWQEIVSLSNLGMATISKLSKLGMAAAIHATLVPPALRYFEGEFQYTDGTKHCFRCMRDVLRLMALLLAADCRRSIQQSIIDSID